MTFELHWHLTYIDIWPVFQEEESAEEEVEGEPVDDPELQVKGKALSPNQVHITLSNVFLGYGIYPKYSDTLSIGGRVQD